MSDVAFDLGTCATAESIANIAFSTNTSSLTNMTICVSTGRRTKGSVVHQVVAGEAAGADVQVQTALAIGHVGAAAVERTFMVTVKNVADHTALTGTLHDQVAHGDSVGDHRQITVAAVVATRLTNISIIKVESIFAAGAQGGVFDTAGHAISVAGGHTASQTGQVD